MITRRTLIVGSAAAAAVAAVVGWQVSEAVADEAVVHAILEKHLGPIAMSEAEAAKFVEGFKSENERVMLGYKLAIATGTALAAGLDDPLRKVLPADDLEELVRFERALLAAFHLMTNFPWRQNASAPVVFIAAGGCRNPFAQFA